MALVVLMKHGICWVLKKVTFLRHRSSTTEEKIAVPFTRVVFIDSTWNQCRGIYKDPRIQGTFLEYMEYFQIYQFYYKISTTIILNLTSIIPRIIKLN
jgi:hypothetical protein